VVHRTIVDALALIAMWVVGLILYYTTDGKYGQPWNNYSYVQLGGFVLLVLGTAIYNEILRFPCFNYEVKESSESDKNETK